ncbi:hypothetical protein JTE90_006148 [Oedothorax gibbosus]|uniref:Protein pinocchio n=1 Tax=Oedothorax gibbosus TaxID=931172 RepID=A0AAV6TXF1_9ARAC|nr:hypothetical protein JTE90_006148 [Oedothorax gibbosus]
MHSKLNNKMRFQNLNNTTIEIQDFEDDEVFTTEPSEDLNLNNHVHDSSDMLTLEGLRREYNSCSNCGVCWYDDHVSLDCGECGGYAMHRPCPTCNGQCGNVWRRDVNKSHVSKHAEWHGSCSLSCHFSNLDTSKTVPTEDSNANFHNSSYHHKNHNHTSETHVM